MLWTNAVEIFRGILKATIISPPAGCMVDRWQKTEDRGVRDRRCEGEKMRR
jgi:hypothetical protein